MHQSCCPNDYLMFHLRFPDYFKLKNDCNDKLMMMFTQLYEIHEVLFNNSFYKYNRTYSLKKKKREWKIESEIETR